MHKCIKFILFWNDTLHVSDGLSVHHQEFKTVHAWSDNKVRELIAVKVLHTSLLNTTVVAFKVHPLGSYAPMSAPSPPFKTILELFLWNGLQSCRPSSGVQDCIYSNRNLSNSYC